MDEVIKKMQELMFNGLEPSLCLVGVKQIEDINKNCLFQQKPIKNVLIDKENVATEYFNIAGHKLKVIRVPDEDFCEVYGKDKFVI